MLFLVAHSESLNQTSVEDVELGKKTQTTRRRNVVIVGIPGVGKSSVVSKIVELLEKGADLPSSQLWLRNAYPSINNLRGDV